MERSVAQGLAVFRWAAWAWVALVIGFSPGQLERPWLAYGLVAAALAVTAGASATVRRDAPSLLRPGWVATELVVGGALLALDGLVRPDDTVFSTGQSLASVWPLSGVIVAGVAFGPVGGALSGLSLGLCRFASTVLNHVDSYGGGRGLSLASTAVFYALAGASFGYVYRLLKRAREEVAAAEAREDIARTLHDGVLQTLALVERRASDPDLARLARNQERELRAYLFGDATSTPGDLGAALRRAAGRFEDTFPGVRVEVVIAGELPRLGGEVVAAIAGAVGEALTNAGKHADARRVVVFVDVEEGELFCSVKDDGRGFEAAGTPEGEGLGRSVRGRISQVGGAVRVDTGPGTGTEVSLRVPL